MVIDESKSSKYRGREVFARYKKFIILISKFYSLFPLKSRIHILNKHRYSYGKYGLVIRYALLKAIARNCGDNVSIFENVYLLNPQNLTIGDNVSIQPMTYIECGTDEKYGVQIGNDVSIAHGVSILSTSHNYQRNDIPIKDQGLVSRKTIINNNVWIGSKVTITAGVMIDEGSVIGANAVVTKNTERNGIYGGVPAVRIKERY